MENNIEFFSFININMNNRIPQSCLDPRGESKSEFLTFCEDRHRNQFDEYNNLPWPKRSTENLGLRKESSTHGEDESFVTVDNIDYTLKTFIAVLSGEKMPPGLETDKDRYKSQFDEYNNLPWPKPGILHGLRSKLPCIDRRGEVDTTDFPQKYDYKYFSYQKYDLNVINYDIKVIKYDQKRSDKKKEGLRYTIKKKEGLRYMIKNKDV